jgi:hypothetical protein
MSARPFICVRTDWNHDPMIQSVSQEAETLAWKILLETNRYGLVLVDPNDVEFYLRSMLFRSRKRLDYWAMPKLSRALNELRSRGVVKLLVQDGRAWLELHKDLRYERGVDKAGQPALSEDQSLPLLPGGPELFSLPPPPHSNESREEKEKIKTSTRARAPAEEELLESLSQIMPPSEMLKNGGMWRERIRSCPKAVAHAVEDYKLRTPDQRREIKNRPAWLTDRHARALVEISRKTA